MSATAVKKILGAANCGCAGGGLKRGGEGVILVIAKDGKEKMSAEGLSIANPFVHGPERGRERAEHLRTIAQDPAMEEWREILLRLATSYAEMAGGAGETDDPE